MTILSLYFCTVQVKKPFVQVVMLNTFVWPFVPMVLTTLLLKSCLLRNIV